MLVSLRRLLDHAAEHGYGLPAFNINNEGIRHGVRKANIDTDVRLVMTGAMRREMARKPEEFDPRKWFSAAVVAARDLCRQRFEDFGSARKAAGLRQAGAH